MSTKNILLIILSILIAISASYKPNSYTRPFPKPSSQREEGIKLDAGASENRCRNEMGAETKWMPNSDECREMVDAED